MKADHRGRLLVALQFVALTILVINAGPALRFWPSALALAASAALMIWAVVSMGRLTFRFHPEPSAQGQLATGGVYRWLRHPMYTAALLGSLASAWMQPNGAGPERPGRGGHCAWTEDALRRGGAARKVFRLLRVFAPCACTGSLPAEKGLREEGLAVVDRVRTGGGELVALFSELASMKSRPVPAMQIRLCHLFPVAALIVAGGWTGAIGLAQDAEPPTLASAEKEFRAQLQTANAPLDALVEQYSTALENLKGRQQQAGNLDLVLKVVEEMERLKFEPFPAEHAAEGTALGQLQNIFARNYHNKRQLVEVGVEKITVAYREQLAEMMRKYTAAGDNDGVEKVMAAFAAIDAPTGGGPRGFRKRLEESVFASRFAEARTRLAVSELKSDLRSPYGKVVTSVHPDGKAAGLGIAPGDRIIRVSRNEIWHQDVDWQEEERARALVWESQDGGENSEQIGPGKIGISAEPDLVMHRYYLHSGRRDGRWDDLVLVAVMMAWRDPALAETAMSRAIDQGYSADALSSAIGAMIALRENRIADAVAFSQHMVQSAPNKDPAMIPKALFGIYCQSLYAGGQLDQVAAAEAAVDVNFSRLPEEKWKDLLSVWKQVRPGWKPADRPSKTLHSRTLEDVFGKRRFDENFLSYSTFDYPTSARGSEVHNVSANHYKTALHSIDGGIQDCVWEMDLTISPAGTEEDPGKFQPLVSMRILNYVKDDARTLVSARFATNFGVADRVHAGSGMHGPLNPYFHFPWEVGMLPDDPVQNAGPFPDEDPEPARMRLIKLGNEVEVQINGSTLLWMPIDPAAKIQDLAFQFNITGMNVNVHRIGLWRIQ